MTPVKVWGRKGVPRSWRVRVFRYWFGTSVAQLILAVAYFERGRVAIYERRRLAHGIYR